MEIGEWVLHERKRQELDIQSFADKAGVNVGTISRIENNLTQPTAVTTFRLVEGLGGKLPEFLKSLDEDYPLQDKLFLEPAKDVLTLSDVEKLVFNFRDQEDKVRFFLATKLNEIILKSPKGRNRVFSSKDRTISFDVTDIDKILSVSDLYRFELRYPLRVSKQIISDTYESKGAMINNDIGAFLRGLNILSTSLPVPFATLERIIGPGSLDRIKFSELMALDRGLKLNTRLLGIFWEVCRFDEKFVPQVRVQRTIQQKTLFDVEEESQTYSLVRPLKRTLEYKIATLYVQVYRWHQVMSNSDESVVFEKYA